MFSGGPSTAAAPAVVRHLTVNTFADPAKPAVGTVSVRVALATVARAPGNYVITLPGGRYALNPKLDALGVYNPGANRTVTVRGRGTVVIDGLSNHGVIGVEAGTTARLENLTVTGGDVGDDYVGGGIFSRGDLTLVKCTVRGNAAAAGAGVATVDGGRLTVVDSTFADNVVGFAGGAVYVDADSSARVFGSLFRGNRGTDPESDGGAISSSGTLDVSRSTFRGNTAGLGGAVGNGGTAAVAGSTFVANHSVGGGGGAIFNAPGRALSIAGCTFTANDVRAADEAGGFTTGFGGAVHNNAGSVNVAGSTFARNRALDGAGGALATTNGGDLTVDRSTFTANEGAVGAGGVAVEQDATLVLRGSTLTGNVSGLYGGGVDNGASALIDGCTFAGNRALFAGGGVSSTVSGVIRNSTFVGNTASQGGGISAGGETTVVNCTLTRNTADGDAGSGLGTGGGILAVEDATVVDCTVVENAARQGAGVAAGDFRNAGRLTLRGTVVAGNIGGSDLYRETRSFADEPSTIRGTYNLIGDGTGTLTAAGHNLLGTRAQRINPLLADLSSYGGRTQTMPPLPGSPVIGAGSTFRDADGRVIATDQRGVARGSRPGIGAAQTRGFVLTAVGGAGQSTPAGKVFDAPLTAFVRAVRAADGSYDPANRGVVVFAATSGTAVASPRVTVAEGRASTVVTAGNRPGRSVVTATAAGAAGVTFALTALGPRLTASPASA
ncbi:MAG TPA: right-handed parallel beta-helix repeat-containing protein [Humisphaera sp.]